MKKIEKAAEAEDHQTTYEDAAFIRGARYVLNQLTSNAAIEAFERVVRKGGNCFSAKDALAAVRKEIEGE